MTEADTKQEAKKVPAWRRKKVGCCIVLGCIILIIVIAVVISVATKHKKHAVGGEFSKDFTVSWAPNHTRLSNHGRRLELFLDPESGSGFKSNNAFLFGSISMDIKLVPADSAGTVTAYYLFSEAANHDELDFEFLGNSSGEPYILQTNVFANGTGEREQRINLWFDPTTDYHRYGVLWNRRQIVFLVDDLPIRVFTNNEDMGMAYPNQQPMGLYSSLWNGDKWATQGGRVKIDWTHAPFIASYQNYHLDACPATDSLAPCASPVANQWWDQPEYQTLSASKQDKLRWVEQNYMVYNYCSDMKRNNGTVPSECTRNSAGFLGLDSLPH